MEEVPPGDLRKATVKSKKRKKWSKRTVEQQDPTPDNLGK